MSIQYSNFQFLSIQGSVTIAVKHTKMTAILHVVFFFFLIQIKKKKKTKNNNNNNNNNTLRVVVPLPLNQNKKKGFKKKKSGTFIIFSFKNPSILPASPAVLFTLLHTKVVLLTQPLVQFPLFHSFVLFGSNPCKQLQIGVLRESQLPNAPQLP